MTTAAIATDVKETPTAVCSVTSGVHSVAGRRETNQDSARVWMCADDTGEITGVAVVADGVGGYAGGEVASRIAARMCSTAIQGALAGADPPDIGDVIGQAIQHANQSVASQAQNDPALAEMATTIAVAVVYDGILFCGNVGDSRVYLVRNNEAFQLTRDDSLLQSLIDAGELSPDDAHDHPMDNLITRCLSSDAVLGDIKVTAQKLCSGDVIVVCSDGFHKFAEGALLRPVSGANPSEHAQALVDAAYAADSDDNITTAVLWYGDPGTRPNPRLTLSYW